MAGPYDWRDDERGSREQARETREDASHRAAQRYSDAVRAEDGDWREGHAQSNDPGRYSRGGDYGAGWYGEDEAARGRDIPGPYGRPSEQDPRRLSDEAGGFDRYGPDGYGAHDARRQDARAYAEHLRDAAGRGWRRAAEHMHDMQQDMRRRFEEDRRPEAVKPGWRAGGMFGGDDRSSSLFSHGPGLPAAGPHSGKGPRDYVRSDDRICEDINERLMADGRLDASDIEVRVEAGEATLAGHVMSREDKRRAEDLAERVTGVKHLQNNLRVKPSQETQAGPAPTSDAPSESKVDPHGSDTAPRLN